MIGLVLSGGQSTRMGCDKGLLALAGKNWAEHAREKLTSQHLQTFVSINPHQLSTYAKYFNERDLVVDNSSLNFGGPLLGLMSLHQIHPEEDILVMACDMVQLQSIVIEKLIYSFGEQPSEAITFKGVSIEPLCSIYSSQGLKKIQTLFQQGLLTKHSMKHLLEVLNTRYLSIPKAWEIYFRNFNQEEDLNDING